MGNLKQLKLACPAILVGAILVAGHAEGAARLSLALVAVVLATVNIVGGFVVTDRMLEMFRRPDARGTGAGTAPADAAADAATQPAGGRR